MKKGSYCKPFSLRVGSTEPLTFSCPRHRNCTAYMTARWWSWTRTCRSSSSCHHRKTCASLRARKTRSTTPKATCPSRCRCLKWVSVVVKSVVVIGFLGLHWNLYQRRCHRRRRRCCPCRRNRRCSYGFIGTSINVVVVVVVVVTVALVVSLEPLSTLSSSSSSSSSSLLPLSSKSSLFLWFHWNLYQRRRRSCRCHCCFHDSHSDGLSATCFYYVDALPGQLRFSHTHRASALLQYTCTRTSGISSATTRASLPCSTLMTSLPSRPFAR